MCLVTGILKCLLGFVNGIIMTIGLICMIFGGILLWGMNSVLPKIFKLAGNLKEILHNLGIQNAGAAIDNVESAIRSNSATIGAVIFILGVILTSLAILIYIGLCCLGLKCIVYVLILIITLLLVSLTIVAIVYGTNGKAKIFNHIDHGLYLLIKGYKAYNATNIESLVINVAQSQLHCCGIYSYKDYENATNWRKREVGQKFPSTCCASKNMKYADLEKCLKTNTSPYMNRGCYTLAKPALEKYMGYIFAGLGISITVLAVLDILFFWIACSDHKSSK